MSTVSGECSKPFNDIDRSHYSTWQSKEPVCYQAECKANEQKNAKVTDTANKLNKEGGVDQESSGAKMFGDMLAGEKLAPGEFEEYIRVVLGPLIAPGLIFAILNFCFGINAVRQTKNPSLWLLIVSTDVLFSHFGTTVCTP